MQCRRSRTHAVSTGQTDFPVKFHGENTPARPGVRKGKSGRLLRRPQPDHPAATVDEFCTAVLSQGAKGGLKAKPSDALAAGITTKIMALTDALGNLIDFRLLPGQAHDLRGTAVLIEGLTCDQFLADRAFDANWLREALTSAGIEPVIPPKSNRRFPAEFDRHTYKWRHLVENFFGKLKEYRGIAMRFLQNR